MPWYLGNAQSAENFWKNAGVGALAVWSLVWTALALWHAARRGDKGWFIVFLLVHTAGIVEFVYLMFVAKVFTASGKKSSAKRK